MIRHQSSSFKQLPTDSSASNHQIDKILFLRIEIRIIRPKGNETSRSFLFLQPILLIIPTYTKQRSTNLILQFHQILSAEFPRHSYTLTLPYSTDTINVILSVTIENTLLILNKNHQT